MKRIITSIVILLASFWSTEAQVMITNGCESSPCNALTICGINTVNQVNSFTSTGNPQGTCGANFFTNNWVYYRFTCYTSGNLTFVLTPNDPLSDLNWALWDITVTGCGSLSNTSTCSAAASAGAVSSGVIPITAGSTYILGVQRASGGTATFGFSINFTGTTASLSNSTQPSMASVLPINFCNPVTEVKVKLTDAVRCSQVSANDFTITTNPTFTVGGSSCPGCVNATTPLVNYSSYEDTIVFTFPTALAPGTYTIGFNPASANLPRNYCNALPNTGPTVSFTVPVPMTLTYSTGFNCAAQTYIDTLQGFNGAPPYQYKVKGGTQTNTYGAATNSYNVFTGLVGNITYTMYVKGSNGCEDSAVVNHPALIPMQAPNLSLSASPPCYNQFALDSIYCPSYSTGQGPYTWSLASTPAAAATSGTYYPNAKWKNLQFTTGAVFTVTVTDMWGCTATAVKNLINPSPLTLPTPTSTNPLCAGDSNGVISVTASGGTGPWNYIYTPFYPPTMDTNNTSPSHIGNQAVNVPAGTYTISVTDAHGCTASVTRTLTTPAAIVIKTTNTPAPQVFWNPTCLAPCSGKIKPSATGGTGTKKDFYIYDTWPGTPFDTVKYIGITTVTDSFFSASAAYPSGLCAGTYTIKAVDQAGCTNTATITLTLPVYPSITLDSTVNVTCNATCTGKIYTTTGGAASPYTYTISPTTIGACTASSIGSNTGDYQNLAAGTYSIVVTKAYGADQCTDTLSNITILEPPALQIGIQSTDDVSCFGGNDGEIEVLAFGGTGTISYKITPLGPQTNTTGQFQNLTAQCYTITATDANGCTITTTACITQPTQLNLTVSSVVNVSCNGVCDGTAQATGSGGTPNYQYTISAPGVIDVNTGAITALCAGTYTVTVTDGNACTKSTSFNVTQPNLLTGSANVTLNALCNGDCNGTATVTPAGGTSPYNYVINGPGSPAINASGATGNATALCAGTYTVQITDANACTTAVIFTITEPVTLTAASALTNNPTCANACNGGGTVTPAGGTSPYNYTINGPGTPSINTSGAVGTALNLCNGVYTIQVTDAHGCTTTATIISTDPPAVTIDTLSVQHALCHNSCDGIITMTAGGGIGGFSYSISPTTNGTCTINQAGNVFNNAWASTYLVTVLDANACSATTNVTVTDPAQFSIDTLSVTPVSCNGGCDGAIEMAFSGGTGLASYTISPTVPCLPSQVAPGLFGNLGSNLYTIQGTDDNGCTATKVVLVSQPTAPTVTIVPGATPSCSPGCDGTAQANPSGGSGGFTFSILPNATTTINASGAVSNVCAGITYTVTATDVNGCTTTSTFMMTTPNGPVASITAYTLPTCAPGCDGKVTINVAGGTAPYTYSINSGNVSITGPTASTTVNGINLCAGTNYTISVMDANQCLNSADTLLNNPASPTVSVSGAIGNVTCNGGCNGSVTVTSTGGTGTVTFGNLVWQNAMTCVPAQTVSGTFTNLGANTYTVTGTDQSGCTGTVSFTVTEPPVLSISVTPMQNVDCNGNCTGIVNFLANGGTPGYNYSINPNSNGSCNATLVGSSFTTLWAATYTISTSDGNGCTASTVASITQPAIFTIDTVNVTPVSCNAGCDGAVQMNYSGGSGVVTYGINPSVPCVPTQNTPGSFGNLGSNLYTVTGTDGNGCQATTNVFIGQPTVVTVTVTPGNLPGCNPGCDGTAQANPSGGTPNYTYTISGSASISASGAISNVCANVVYTVTAHDANGCTGTATLIMNTTTNTPTVTITNGTLPSCNPGCDGTAQANPSAGNPGYTYQITGTATISASGAISNVCANVVYTVTVTDASGCTGTATFSMTNPNAPTLTISQGNLPGCNPGCDGTAQANPSGGTPGYTYQISGTASVNASGAISNVCANVVYTVTVADANGCTGTATFSMTTTTNTPTVTITTGTLPSCNPGCDGTAQANPSAGNPGYTYQISGTATINGTGAISNVCANVVYTVTVTDASGCTGTVTFSMTNPNAPTLTITPGNLPGCNPGCDGTAQANPSGGTPGYTYQITGTATVNASGAISNVCANVVYTVTVADANGCTATNTFIMGTAASPTLTVTPGSQPGCNPGCDGTAQANPGGGAGNYTYSVSGSASVNTTGAVSALCAAVVYTVTTADANGCTATATVSLSTAASPTLTLSGVTNPSCTPGCDGTAQANPLGGVGTYTYSVSGGASVNATGLVSNICAGVTYTVTVQDANGCTATSVITMTTPNGPVVSITATATTNPSCSPGCDGTMTISVLGGTSPYTYSINNGAGLTTTGPTALTTTTGNGLCDNQTYTLTVTDANQCVGFADTLLLQPAGPTADTVSTTPINCYLDCNGTVTVTSTGGTAPIVYALSAVNASPCPSPTATSAISFGGLGQNDYIVKATDANGCVGTFQFTMLQPSQLNTDTVSTTNISCNGNCNGQIVMTSNGGTAPYNYTITPTNIGPCVANVSGSTISGLGAGTYTVTSHDAHGCIATKVVTLTQPAVFSINTQTVNNVSCNNLCDGSVVMTFTGGTGPVSYSILPIGGPCPPAQTTLGTFTGLAAGTYTVSGTDSKGCTATKSFTITQPTVLGLIINPLITPSCGAGCNGTAQANGSGGTAAYTYQIVGSPSVTINTNNGAISGICSGITYTVTVTDAHGCTKSQTFVITTPGAPTISVSNTTTPTCQPGCDGTASVTVLGGTAPLTYTVSGSAGATMSPAGPTASATSTANNLCASINYVITVTDANACSGSTTVNLNPPAVPVIDTLSTTPVSCTPGCDGTITMTPAGLVYTVSPAVPVAGATINNLCSNTTYTIVGTNASNCKDTFNYTPAAPLGTPFSVTATNPTSNGATNGTIQVGPIVVGSTYSITPNGPQTNATGLFVGLDSNCYTITVTNAQGCTATTTTCIDDPDDVACTVNSITHVSCFGGNNGAYDINAVGGFGTLTFSSNPAGVDPVTGDASGLSAGSYTITVTDQNLITCSQVVVINQPALLGFNLPTIVKATCTNPCSGSINIAATGGTAPYTYSIQSPAIGCAASQANPNAGSFTNIGTGTYTINVVDLNGCTASITVIVAPPTPPTINAVGTTNVTCNGACNGQIIINAASATSYSINNGSNYQPSNTFNAVCAGTYTVVAQGSNGCTTSSVVNITEPPAVIIDSVTTTNVLCAGGNTGTIVLYASGGVGGIQYSLDCTNYQAANTFNTLAAGTYTLCVKDANNCTKSTLVTITAPPAMSWVYAIASDVTCNAGTDGAISVQAQGGTGTILYANNGGLYSATSNYLTLGAGIYTITAKDQNNCIISTNLTINEPPALFFNNPTVVNNLCFGTNAGSISISAGGGTPYVNGYTFVMIPMPAGAVQSSPGYFENLPAGTYAITVFDSVGCSKTYTPNIAVTQPQQIIITVQQKVDIECYGAATGLIDVDATGGTGALTYTLMPNNSSNGTGLFNNLTAGSYTLFVKDQNNCTSSVLITLNQPPPISVATVIPTEPICHGDANGAVNIIAQGGQPPYQYSLDGGPLQPSGIFTGLVAKNYLITIVDSKGCQHQENYTLTEPDFVGAQIVIRDAKCIDSKDGRAEITGTGGRGGYSYFVMPGLLFNKSGLFTNLAPGLYHLTVKDTAGCMYETDFTINPPANPLGVNITKKDLGCTGKGFEGQATANVFGGEQPYTYLWFTNPIQTDAIADSLYYGWYQLQVTDAYGCVVKDSVYIEEGPCCDVSFIPNAFSPNGDGNNDVFRVLTTAGIELQQLEVYDRWGKRVWSTNNYRFGWDGTLDGKGAEVGTYYYVFRYKCTRDQKNYVKKGDLILVR